MTNTPPAATIAVPDRRQRHFNWVRIAEAYALKVALLALGAVFGMLRPEAFLSWATSRPCSARRRCL
ncbi:hypothetical protein [Rhodopila sp.]|uniref:hypothetical protein n=1 Tax=Rhodopila sp. TaxID=2480087 RepID=UPI003D129E1B